MVLLAGSFKSSTEITLMHHYPSGVLDSIYNQVEELRFCSVLLANKTVVKKVDGGYWIEEGFWGFGSGSKHATHALLNLQDRKFMQEGGAMGMMLAVIP